MMSGDTASDIAARCGGAPDATAGAPGWDAPAATARGTAPVTRGAIAWDAVAWDAPASAVGAAGMGTAAVAGSGTACAAGTASPRRLTSRATISFTATTDSRETGTA